MFQNGVTLRFTPDNPGRGGIKSGLHSFGQQGLKDVRTSENLLVRLRRWEKVYAPTTVSDFHDDATALSGKTRVSHPYYLYNITSPSKFSQVHLLSQSYDTPGAVQTGEHIWDHTSATAGSTLYLPVAGAALNDATFSAFVVQQTGSIKVWIDASGTPDTFSWRSPTGAITAGVAIVAGPQALGAYVAITFAATTGHAVGDAWVISTPVVRRMTNGSILHDCEFANTGQRCFFSSGLEAIQIYSWAAAYPQVYELGAPTPTVPLTYSINYFTTTSACFIVMGVSYLMDPSNAASPIGVIHSGDNLQISQNFSHPSSAAWNAVATGDALFIVRLAADGDTLGRWESALAGGIVQTVGPSVGPPTLTNDQVLVNRRLNDDQRYAGLAFTYAGVSHQIDLTEVDPTNAAWSIITLVAGSGPLGVAAGNPFDIQGTRVPMNTVAGYDTPPVTVHLKAVSVTHPDGAIRVSWGQQPPIYAYAYYDYETGHISNLSPLMYVKEKDLSNVDVDLNFDSTMNPPLADQARFKHIIIFRNVLGGGGTAMFAIGKLPTKAVTPASCLRVPLPASLVWFDLYKDSDLLLSGALMGPRFTNGRPTVTLATGAIETSKASHIAYWDQRLWTSPAQEPSIVQYSADFGQVTFGVAAESFPEENVLRIPAEDGAITGLKLVGSQLLVMTRRWAYYVAGNNQTNYRLLRYSTTMGGVGPYQITEVSSQLEEQGATVAFFAPDGRLYAYAPGGQPQWISEEVNDKIVASYDFSHVSYLNTRVHSISSWSRRGVAVALSDKNGANGALLFFDLETKTWTRLGTAVAPNLAQNMTTIYNGVGDTSTALSTIREIRVNSGGVAEWFGASGLCPTVASFDTFPIYPDDPKRLRQINFIRLYCDGRATAKPWEVRVYPDETSMVSMTPEALAGDALPFSIYSQKVGSNFYLPVDGATVEELVAYPSAGTRRYDSSGVLPVENVEGALVGHRFVISVIWPDRSAQGIVYAMDVSMSDVGDQGATTA